jgi:hypothetical protein
LDAVKEDAEYASSQHQAGAGVLAHHLQENAKLKDKVAEQAQEIENLKTQLTASHAENRKIKETLFGKSVMSLRNIESEKCFELTISLFPFILMQ